MEQAQSAASFNAACVVSAAFFFLLYLRNNEKTVKCRVVILCQPASAN